MLVFWVMKQLIKLYFQENIQILRDLSLLQVQMRDLDGFRVSHSVICTDGYRDDLSSGYEVPATETTTSTKRLLDWLCCRISHGERLRYCN